MKKIILLLSILMISCSEENNLNSQELTIESISKGVLHGTSVEDDLAKNYIIADQEQWSNFLNKVNERNHNIEEQQFDFSKFTIIGTIDTIREYNGYSIEIRKILKSEQNIQAILEYKNTQGISPVQNQPYHLVKIPKTSKNITFTTQ